MGIRNTPLCFILLLFSASALAQDASCHCPSMSTKGKRTIYGGIGFHRVFFTRSDIHFRDSRTANYDFILYEVKARDDNSFRLGQGFDAPQYSLRLGYIFNNGKGLGVEISFDHVKYIAVQGQTVRLKGQINGIKYDKDTVVTSNFLEYEHTDGANYYMVHLVKRKPLLHSGNEKHWLSLILKPGAGFVLPRSDTRIMGLSRNDKYHLAGYVIGMDGSLRYDFLRNFYAEASLKTAYANYRDVLLYGDGRARQHWFSLQAVLLLGFQYAF